MKKIISLALLASILIPNLAIAEDKLPSEPPPSSYLVPIKNGQISPFDGLLLSEGAAAEIIADKKLFPEKIIVEVSKAREQEKADCKLKIENEKSSCSEQRVVDLTKLKEKDSQINVLNEKLKSQADLERKLKETEKSITYYTFGGVAAGIATTLLTGFVISKISR